MLGAKSKVRLIIEAKKPKVVMMHTYACISLLWIEFSHGKRVFLNSSRVLLTLWFLLSVLSSYSWESGLEPISLYINLVQHVTPFHSVYAALECTQVPLALVRSCIFQGTFASCIFWAICYCNVQKLHRFLTLLSMGIVSYYLSLHAFLIALAKT